MVEQIQPARAGFWRRIFAFAVDIFTVTLLLQPVAVFTSPLTGGRVQLTNSVISSHHDCTTLTSIPPGITITAFEPNYIIDCRSSLFGRTVAHSVEIGRKTRAGDTTTDGSITVAVDEAGRPIGIFHLDWLILPLAFLFRWGLDRRGATPGRRLARIHVEARDTAERPAPGLAKRYGLFVLPILPVLPVQIWPIEFLNFFGAMPFIYSMFALAIVEGVMILAFVIVPIVKRRDAFYDRCAGTAVVLSNRPAAEQSATASA